MSGTNPSVFQSKRVTPGHVAVWTTDGVLQDGGSAGFPQVTDGIGILSSNASSFAIDNAPATGPYSSLSFGITQTAANITVTSFNGAPVLPLTITGVNLILSGNLTIDGLVSALILTDLPTSDAGLVSGRVWLNGGFLAVKT